MDPELREYLEQRFAAIEGRMATKADLERMATKADLDGVVEHLRTEIRAGDEETRRTIRTEIQALDAKIDMTARELRQGQTSIIHRLDAGFAARKQDEDLALGEIERLKARVAALEKRK